MADEKPAGNDTAFYVVLSLVFLITISSLGLALWQGTLRTAYVNSETARLQKIVEKGEITAAQKDGYTDIKTSLAREESNQQNVITILMGVFQAGTGAILGLLTGRVTAAKS